VQDAKHERDLPGIVRVLWLLLLLYGFLLAIQLLGGAFKLLGAGATEMLAGVANPFAGLAVGVLATVLVQSSSTTTSVIVALVGSGTLDVSHAVPMVMGANIGTTVTNTLVSSGTCGGRRRSAAPSPRRPCTTSSASTSHCTREVPIRAWLSSTYSMTVMGALERARVPAARADYRPAVAHRDLADGAHRSRERRLDLGQPGEDGARGLARTREARVRGPRPLRCLARSRGARSRDRADLDEPRES
jgi:hypothetical protein